MDLHKARELFELGRGEGIWMSEAQLVDRRAYAPPRHVKPVASADDDQIRLGKNGVKVLVGLAQRVVERGAEQMVPSIMEKTGLSREDAYLLFVHNVQGNLAVNRLLGWKRGPEFAHAQELLGAYSEGGLQAVSSLHDSHSSS